MKSVVCRRRRRAKEVAGLILLVDWHVTFLSNNTYVRIPEYRSLYLLTSTLLINDHASYFEILCLGILLNHLRTHSAC